MTYKIKCTVDDPNIQLPEYQSAGASGMDLRAWKYKLIDVTGNLTEDFDFPEQGFKLRPYERVLINTGLHIQLPPNLEAQVRPRSGLALKHGVTVLNSPGTVDADYRGSIGVILINHNSWTFVINKGDRIAQLVFQEVAKGELEIECELDDTDRGEGAYNSTGTK